jgi:hypothetical protein
VWKVQVVDPDTTALASTDLSPDWGSPRMLSSMATRSKSDSSRARSSRLRSWLNPMDSTNLRFMAPYYHVAILLGRSRSPARPEPTWPVDDAPTNDQPSSLLDSAGPAMVRLGRETSPSSGPTRSAAGTAPASVSTGPGCLREGAVAVSARHLYDIEPCIGEAQPGPQSPPPASRPCRPSSRPTFCPTRSGISVTGSVNLGEGNSVRRERSRRREGDPA